MRRLASAIVAIVLVCGAPRNSATVHAAEITAEEARAIAVDGYVYLYPLVSMDITRRQSTNIEPGKEIAKGSMNMFVSVPEYPPADLKIVVCSASTRAESKSVRHSIDDVGAVVLL
jgi:hypothetical protein